MLFCEERLEVGEGEFRRSGIAGLEHAGQQRALLALQREHLLFNRICSDQFVTGDNAGLANAVRTIGGLRLRGGIPPGIKMYDRVRTGEIEAGAASFEREEEERDVGR